MASPSLVFVLILALLARSVRANDVKCPDASNLIEGTYFSAAQGFTQVQAEAKDGSTIYRCEQGVLMVYSFFGAIFGFDPFKPDLENVNNVLCDSSGKWHVTLSKSKKYETTTEFRMPMLACYGQAKCTVNVPSIGECLLKNCKPAILDKDSHFFECESNYQLETYDSFRKLWDENVKLQCVGKYIVDYDSNVQFRCRKKKDESNACYYDEYYDEQLCHQYAICERPTRDGKCARGKLKIFSAQWHYASVISCDEKRQWHQWLLGRAHIAPPELVACIIADEVCSIDFSKYICPPNDDCRAMTKVGAHLLKCADQGYEFEAKSDKWYWVREAICYGTTIYTYQNGIPNVDAKYTNARCRKPRECKVDNYYSNACDKTILCGKPLIRDLKEFYCTDSYELQYTPDLDSGNWINADTAICKEGRLTLKVNGIEVPHIIPNKVRCIKKKRCDLENFYIDDKCADFNIDCKKPTQVPVNAQKALQCESEFGLQAKYDNIWEDIQSAICIADPFLSMRFQVVGKNGIVISVNKYAIGYRCVRKKIDKFYDNSGCQTQICDKPQFCNEMKCSSGLTLLTQLDGLNWMEVQSARCNSGTFIGTLIDRNTLKKQKFDQPSVGVKCALEKCSYCENPCPSCKPEFNAIFTKSTKWDECTTFECGPHTRTIFNPQSTSSKSFENAKLKCSSFENGLAKWEVNGETIETQEIKCEKLCTLNSPLEVKCDAKDLYCVEVSLDNENQVACSRKLFFAEDKIKMVEISNLHCNKVDGLWRALAKEGNAAKEIIVLKNGKISCHYGCDIAPYNTQICDGDSVCESLLPNYACPGNFGLQAKFDDKSNGHWFDITKISCVNHRFVTFDHQNAIIDKNPHDFRCIHKNIAKFFYSSDCTTQEDCEQPKNCASLTCEKGFGLQSKTVAKPVWDVAGVIRCDSNKFTGLELKDVNDLNSVRCVRLKCTTCNDPCPTCKPEFKAVFAKSTKWNECATFECGVHTRTTFHPNSKQFTNAKILCNSFENGAAKWSANGEVFDTEEVKCEKLCTLNSLLDTKCNPDDSHCEEVNLIDDSSIACTKKLYFTTTTSPLMKEVSSLFCDKLTGLWTGIKIANAKAETVPTGSKIHCHHGCDIHAYYKTVVCEADSECHEPKLQDENPCKTDFGLQAKFDAKNGRVWTDISKIMCWNTRFHIYGVDQKKIDKFAHEIRCIRKKIDHLFDNSIEFCDDEKECKQPINCSSMKCGPQWALQITKSIKSPIIWTDVDSLRCDSDKFTGSHKIDVKEVNKVRCVRLKCTRCENPCPTCQSSPTTKWKFTPSTKWNECSKFECGKNTHTMIDTISTKFDNAELVCHSIGDQGTRWNIETTQYIARKVECESKLYNFNFFLFLIFDSCSLRHPLVSECAPNDFCEEWIPEDDEPNTCLKKMFYKSPQAGLVAISKLSCNKISGAWEAIRDDVITKDAIPGGSSLSCHAGCHVPFYFSTCDKENDCEEPTMSEDRALSCRDEFGLQVDYGQHQTTLGWQHVSSVLCEKYRFKVYDKTNVEISAFPKGIRCIRKNIAHFLHGCDATKEDCQIPSNCTSLACEPQWNLQVRFGTNPWSQIQSASCNSDKFSVVDENGDKSTVQPTAVRCVRWKCAFCTTPCPKCHVNSKSVFNQSTKWDECAEFACDSHADLVIDSNSGEIRLQNAELVCETSKNNVQSWITKDGLHRTTSDVICENSCEHKSPLNSSCKPNSTTCEELKKSVFECPRKMFYENNGIPEEIQNLSCEREEGIWKAIRVANDTELAIPKGSNVYCHAGDCEIDRIFPTCQEDECEEFLREGNRFYCTGTSSFWSRQSDDEDWEQMKGVKDLFCVAGSIVLGGKAMNYDFRATCRIVTAKAQIAGSKMTQNVAIVTLILVVIVIIVANVLLRVTGERWLHTIILKRVRGKKRKAHKSAVSPNPAKSAVSPKPANSAVSPNPAKSAVSPYRSSHSQGSGSSSKKKSRLHGAKPGPSSNQSSVAYVSSEEPSNMMSNEPNTNVYQI